MAVRLTAGLRHAFRLAGILLHDHVGESGRRHTESLKRRQRDGRDQGSRAVAGKALAAPDLAEIENRRGVARPVEVDGVDARTRHDETVAREDGVVSGVAEHEARAGRYRDRVVAGAAEHGGVAVADGAVKGVAAAEGQDAPVVRRVEEIVVPLRQPDHRRSGWAACLWRGWIALSGRVERRSLNAQGLAFGLLGRVATPEPHVRACCDDDPSSRDVHGKTSGWLRPKCPRSGQA